MSCLRRPLLTLLALAASAASAHAIVPGPESRGEVRLPGITAVRTENAARQSALDGSAAWRSFRARNGDWSAFWNEATGTPHRAFGRGARLEGFANDAASVDGSVRRFVQTNPDLFGGTPTLRTVSVQRHGDTWYARYRQTLGGLDVLFSDWEFRVHESGRLTMFGADAAPTATVPARRGLLVSAAARERAREGVEFDAARDRVESAPELYVLPYPTESGVEYRTVSEHHVITANPPADWLTYVDARTGEVLFRTNRVRFAIAGTVTGTIHPAGPLDPLQARNLPDLYVTVGPSTVFTATNGTYTANPAGTVTVSAGLRGRWCDVNRSDAPDATFSTSATNPATVNIAWGTVPSHVAERDAYYHVNVAHAHVKTLDPGLTFLDYEVPAIVNIASTCNAFWNGTGVNFFAAGNGCENTATIADVVYHEYGHGVNDNIYEQEGVPNGMINGALHEGMADVFATLLEDDPILGQGFSGPGTFVRNVDNTNRWPEDNAGEGHTNGLVIGGAFWDLRQSAGLAVARQLAVEALHGTPDDLQDGIAMREMFIEVLVADDDNGNLADGTPHGTAIINAFNLHGIGTNAFLSVAHTVPADFTGGSTVDVTASFVYSGPAITTVDPASPTLHYRANRGPWQTAAMPSTGTPNQYRATMPAPTESVLEYYMTGADLTGGTVVSPAGAPNKSLYRIVHGTQQTMLSWDMETDPLWTVGDPGDLAPTGVWIRDDPMGEHSGDPINGFYTQPADDHTVAGFRCFVTANGDSTQDAPGLQDVDAGRTTLTTATFSALAGGFGHPAVEYWRWYTNNAGNAPNEDFWQVDISNNGGATWTPVENTNASDAAWQRVVLRIEDYIAPTANMRLRFVASDENEGSLVEAAVDDFRLLMFPTGGAGVGDPAPVTLALGSPFPNPSGGRQTVHFTLPEATRATLRVYDVTGRAVATLADGELAAGAHDASWTGLDESGRRAAAGVYFVRLSAGGLELVRRVMRLE